MYWYWTTHHKFTFDYDTDLSGILNTFALDVDEEQTTATIVIELLLLLFIDYNMLQITHYINPSLLLVHVLLDPFSVREDSRVDIRLATGAWKTPRDNSSNFSRVLVHETTTRVTLAGALPLTSKGAQILPELDWGHVQVKVTHDALHTGDGLKVELL